MFKLGPWEECLHAWGSSVRGVKKKGHDGYVRRYSNGKKELRRIFQLERGGF